MQCAMPKATIWFAVMMQGIARDPFGVLASPARPTGGLAQRLLPINHPDTQPSPMICGTFDLADNSVLNDGVIGTV